MTLTDARPGDILLDSAGTAWQRGPEVYSWATFSGPVFFYGPWSDAYGPQGELVLLARDGKPAAA
jgi:hypothetical protein